MFAKLTIMTFVAAMAVSSQTTNVTIDQVEQAFTAANIVPSGTLAILLLAAVGLLRLSLLQ